MSRIGFCPRTFLGLIVAVTCVLTPSRVQAGIPTGTYDLSNHPDGGAATPYYGFRLDELYDVRHWRHDVFTFDFNHAESNMQMTFDGNTIHIFGDAYGGLDIGGSYADNQYLGVYQIDFTYDMGVGMAAGDNDLLVDAANYANAGTIMTPLGDTIGLWDYRGRFDYSFRFGDENDDQGHRDFAGLSGWGWVNHGDQFSHVAASDWLFTAKLIPAPGAALLATLGIGMVAWWRKRTA